jgi:hypothetical protein
MNVQKVAVEIIKALEDAGAIPHQALEDGRDDCEGLVEDVLLKHLKGQS